MRSCGLLLGVSVLLACILACDAAAGTPRDPQVQLAPADTAWAEQLVPASSDLGPGWTVTAKSLDDALLAGIPDGTSAFARDCASGATDLSDLVVTGAAGGEAALGENVDVIELATVWRSAADAGAYFDRESGESVVPCVTESVETAAPPGSRLAVVGSSTLAFAAPGADRVVAYRIDELVTPTAPAARKRKAKAKQKARPRPRPIAITQDIVFVSRGRATAFVAVTSLAPGFALAGEQALAALVAGRMSLDPVSPPQPG